MPDEKLVQYFKDNLSKYDAVQLKNQLVQQGHDVYEVEKALTAATGHPKRSIILWSVIAILGVAILIGAYLVFSGMVDKEPVSQAPQPSDEMDFEADVEQVEEPPCDDAECAQQALKDCLPATGSYSMFFGSVAVEYEIIGPEGEYCKAKSWFTANPNEDYLNKEMTCLYDSDIPLEDAVKDMSRCEGELADTIFG